MVRILDFSRVHGKNPPTGSTHLRVMQLIKHWDEADLYLYGENPDTLIFQKVYITQDYKFPAMFENTKILDICDPDWLDGALIKETVNAMDGIVTATKPLADFISQLTDKPIQVIPDRFDLDSIPPPKKHTNSNSIVWYGYSHNAELLKFAIPMLERNNLNLTIISNQDPMVWRWGTDYKDKCKFVKYNEQTIYKELQKHDICLLPKGHRPQDRFKSNNKTIKANLAGLPVATNGDELLHLLNLENRQKEAEKAYKQAVEEYDVKISVAEYKEFIEKANRK